MCVREPPFERIEAYSVSLPDARARTRGGSAGACTSRGSFGRTVLVPDDRELVLGVLDPLLELPAVGGRFAALDALELRARLFELPPRSLVVDLARVDGVVDERDRAVELDLEE